MARNGLAGTKKGKSRSALYYQNNPESRAKKQSYDSSNNKKKSSVLYRTSLNKANRENPNSKIGDGKDSSHTSSGLKLKTQKANRGSKTDSAGDRRARGGKNKK
tara:strand:- start:1321 stop:1632 length:312 start_codon:yes stop_codon:yes gene_type:complete